ncbi:MAG: helix-hairpin-helix domain-containing protein [Chloroflexota bacterium]|nr:MAG: helix-hairpin-helix domain-containing protein [Chloroflexota bacterium]
MSTLSKEQLPWLVVALFLGIAIGALAVILSGRNRPAPIYITPASPTATPTPTLTPQPSPSPSPLRVHISGEVVAPDVYMVPAGAILRDAIDAAGGLNDAAAADVINLALPLADGMHIHVPALNQLDSAPPLVERAPPAAFSPEAPSGELINLNTATLEELDQLPGIGPATAQKIVDYRQANGPFNTVDDVENVSGIGPAKLEQIRPLVTVE